MSKRNYNDWEDEEMDEEYGSGPRYISVPEEDDLDVIDDDSDDEVINDFMDDMEIDEDKPTRQRQTNKPKLIGKHSLAYDTIFKGKRNEVEDEEEQESEHFIKNAGGSLDISDESLEFEESRNSIDYYRDTRLKHEISKLLKQFTDINFLANRRKPAKSDFNAYFAMLIKELYPYGYTRTEIFIELSGYFSDNIYNMFLLLDKQYSSLIIAELKDKHGLSDIEKIDFLA
jgi:hypothetical protein